MNVNTIEGLKWTRVSDSTWNEFHCNMFIERSDEIFCSGRISNGNSKIINLMTNENILIVKFTNTKIAFMSCIVNVKLVKWDVIDHGFPLKTTSRMTLKRF